MKMKTLLKKAIRLERAMGPEDYSIEQELRNEIEKELSALLIPKLSDSIICGGL